MVSYGLFALREVVTAETWKEMSRKLAREKLEEKLGVGPDGLKAHKKEINEILDKIVNELSAERDSVGISPTLGIVLGQLHHEHDF